MVKYDDKYVVFKSEEWHSYGDYAKSECTPLIDAVVMRTGDVFAHAALESYANIVRVYAGGVAGMIAELEPSKRMAAQEMLDRLMGIAGYFADCAQEAEDRLANGDVKVPD